MWMALVLLYGLLKGTREIVKKKSLQYSSVMDVLFFYTLFAFIMVLPSAGQAFNMKWDLLIWVFAKSCVIFLAWILSFKAIKKMPISLYGVLDLSRVLFATLLGSLALNEVMSTTQIVGLILVAGGLLLLKVHKKSPDGEEKIEPLIVFFSLASCMLNALSGLLDKLLMQSLNSSQLQFWYMLFLVLLYGGYLFLGKEEVHVKQSIKNPWIWLLALLFVIADKALFVANASPESRITVMTLIKQSGCIVTLAAGKFIYHEKHILHRAFCTVLVVTGIVVAVL